jgi:hypothetical protein
MLEVTVKLFEKRTFLQHGVNVSDDLWSIHVDLIQ